MYSKDQQTKKNKRPKITQHEKDYLKWLNNNRDSFRCMVCFSPGVEFHHVKLNSTDKKKHTELIPLCKFHHVGNEISPHGTPRKWREIYSMDYQKSIALEGYERFKSEI